MKLFGTGKEHAFGLGVPGIGRASLRWTHGLTSLMVEEAHTFGASSGIDHVFAISLADSIVGTFGLASATIDTFIGDMSCHVAPFMDGITANAGTAKSTAECIDSTPFRQPTAAENRSSTSLP
jgi:hypothetical protein